MFVIHKVGGELRQFSTNQPCSSIIYEVFVDKSEACRFLNHKFEDIHQDLNILRDFVVVKGFFQMFSFDLKHSMYKLSVLTKSCQDTLKVIEASPLHCTMELLLDFWNYYKQADDELNKILWRVAKIIHYYVDVM